MRSVIDSIRFFFYKAPKEDIFIRIRTDPCICHIRLHSHNPPSSLQDEFACTVTSPRHTIANDSLCSDTLATRRLEFRFIAGARRWISVRSASTGLNSTARALHSPPGVQGDLMASDCQPANTSRVGVTTFRFNIRHGSFELQLCIV